MMMMTLYLLIFLVSELCTVLFRANFDILSEYQFDDDDNDDDDDADIVIDPSDVTTASYYDDSALIQQDTDDTAFDSNQPSQAHCWTTDHHNPPQSYVRTLQHLID